MTRGNGALRVLLQILRAQDAGDPYAFRFGPQDYILPTASGDSPSARFNWTPDLLADLQAVRLPGRDPAVVQRVGERLNRFVEKAGWEQHEGEIAKALAEHHPIILTVRSSAAEMYALPWELLTLKTGQFIGEVDGLLLRFEWPESHSTPEHPKPRPEGGRILVAWSAASGTVPAAEHIQAIATASTAGFHPFDSDTDVLAHASLGRIAKKLEQAQQAGSPIAVLHLLCHGGAAGSTFGLCLDGADGPVVVDAAQLREQLSPFASTVRLVVLSACDSGNAGALGNQLGSVAQTLHRCGFAAVIASRFPISVAGSITLTESFYGELLAGPASLETAFLAARKSLARSETDLPREQRQLDWASVQLYARHEDGDDTRPVVFRPFRGLLAFQSEHRRFFFGRDKEVQQILAALQALIDHNKERFVVVAGASGTGKSSLVFAGAVPKLLEKNPQLGFLRMRPGKDPDKALNEVLATCPAGTQTLLVVDQFEEVFTQTEAPAAREAFVRRLWSLASAPWPGLRVIITLRVDFIGRCGELAVNDTGRRLDHVTYDEQHRVFVAQLEAELLRAAIVEPARKVGLELQAGVSDRMLLDVGNEPGGLPLLADVLDVLWQHREERTLTQTAYDELGGVVGALQRRADAIIGKLAKADLDIAQRLLLNLVAVADDTTLDTRLRVALVDLQQSFSMAPAAGFERVLKEMVSARLLVQDGDEQTSHVEVAHEALIRKWPKLRAWLDEDRAGLLMQRRVKQAAQQWLAQNHDESLLYRGAQLAQTSDWRMSWEARLGPLERRFLDESEALRVRTAKQRTRLLRLSITILSSLTLLACVLGGLAVRQTQLANQRLVEAVTVAGQIVTIGEERLVDVAGASEARRDLLALSSKLLKTLNASGHSEADHAQVWRLFKQADLILSNPHRGEQQIQEATRLYEQALAIASIQVKRNPRNTGWLRDLSVSFDKLGGVLETAGKLPEATARYEESLAISKKLAAADPSNTGWLRDLSVSYNKLGGVLETAGKLPEATAHYEESLAISKKLAAADPSNTGWLRDLSVSFDKLGGVLETAGKLPEATARYEESLAISKKLAAADPSNTGWLRDLSVSFDKLGGVLETAGKLPEATARYEESLAISKKLAAADPSNTGWLRDLSVSFDKLGGVLETAGKLPEATARYEESLAISKKLAAADPSNTGWLRDLSVSFDKLGGVLETAGKLPEATARYEESLAISKKLAAADPSNTGWLRDLSVSFDNLGGVLETAGKLPEATARYEESLAIRKKLAAADPSNTGWLRDLSVSFDKLGGVLETAGKLPEATARYEESLAIRKKLAAADPSNTGWLRDLSVSFDNLGGVLETAGKLPEATARYEESLAIRKKLAAADPSNTGWLRDLSVSYNKLGGVLETAGKLPEATARYEESLAISKKLAAADPSNTGWLRDLSVSFDKLGGVLETAGKLPEATARYEESLAISKKLAAADPSNTGWLRDLSVSFDNLGGVLEKAGKLPEATARYEESLAISKKLAAADPSNTQWQRDLASDSETLEAVRRRRASSIGRSRYLTK